LLAEQAQGSIVEGREGSQRPAPPLVTKESPPSLKTHAKIAFMQVKVNVPDRLAAEAQARGVSLEMYVEGMLAQQLGPAEEGTPQGSVSEAIDRIRELRKQNTLGGLRTKDLIHEGHKY
jgi:hypothetical protein